MSCEVQMNLSIYKAPKLKFKVPTKIPKKLDLNNSYIEDLDLNIKQSDFNSSHNSSFSTKNSDEYTIDNISTNNEEHPNPDNGLSPKKGFLILDALEIIAGKNQ